MDAQYSGVSEYTLNLLKEILKLDNKNDYRLFYNCFGDCPGIPEFVGKNVKVIKYDYPNKIFNYLLCKFFNYPKMDKELDVDIFFMPHINFIGLSRGRRKVITIHDLSFLEYPEFFNWRKNFWHKMINVKKLIKRFDCMVAVSENTKRDIIELCGVSESKIKVIYAGVGEEFRKIVDDEKLLEVKNKYKLPDKFILYLGTVEPRKNVDGIIKAYNEIRTKNQKLTNVKLIVAGGRGWKSNNIYKEWEQSKFKDDVIFLGYVDNADKPYLYNLATMFVYPSFYEGFGFPPLEAMACGLPVVASFAASLPELTAAASLMVDPYNIDDIAIAMQEVLTDENLKNKLIEEGFSRAKNFSWRKTAEEYLKIFDKL